jgi:hypothetical protein
MLLQIKVKWSKQFFDADFLIHATVIAQELFANSIKFEYTVTCIIVTIDGVWIGTRIYWTLTDP